MTQREKQIINLIKENPLITQDELAIKLGCARTSIAVHISNLMKKGVILGKKYIVNEEPYILTIGGTNVDIQGKSYGNVIRYDSNPGSITISFGGVGKNIAENISKLGISSKLVTVLGDDIYGKEIQEYLHKINLDVSDTLFLNNQATSMYISILNDDKEVEMAVASTDICQNITPTYLETIRKRITNAKMIVLDTNLDEKTLSYMAYLRGKPNLMLDTVSSTKALKVKNFIGKFHTVKCNKLEAEILTDIQIKGDEDLYRIGEALIKEGVKNVFISLGRRGVFYMNILKSGIMSFPKTVIASANGSAEAFVAGIVYGQCNDLDIVESTKIGLGASILTSLSDKTVSEHLNIKNVNAIIKEMEI